MPRGIPNNPRKTRTAKKTQEAFVKFLNPDLVPEEMKLTGKGAGKKGLPVVVLSKTAKAVELQYTSPKKGRAKQVLRCTAIFPIEAVVLYNVEAVDVEAVAAPVTVAAPKKRASPKKKAAPKKVAKKVAKKKAAPKKVAKKKAAPKKKKVVRRKKKAAPAEEAPKKRRKKKKTKTSAVPPKKVRKKKKGKKTRKFGSSSRRKTSFRLDDDD